MGTILGIIILLAIICIMYLILFWVVKQVSKVIADYESSDKESKLRMFWGFVLYSGFIIAPSYIILNLIIKIFQMIYQ